MTSADVPIFGLRVHSVSNLKDGQTNVQTENFPILRLCPVSGLLPKNGSFGSFERITGLCSLKMATTSLFFFILHYQSSEKEGEGVGSRGLGPMLPPIKDFNWVLPKYIELRPESISLIPLLYMRITVPAL